MTKRRGARRRVRAGWGCLSLLALPPSLAAAQEQPRQSIPDIVVIGSPLALPPGTPAYGSVTIDRERLTGDASGRVEDALGDVAGVAQYRRSDSRSANPSAQGIAVRGLGGNATARSLVLLDGVPIADPFFGSIPFNALSPERLGAVRVTRGGGSGPFGAGAVAGTIELISASRAQLPLVAADLDAGSFNSQRVDATVSPDVGPGYATVFGRWERSDGFQTTPPDERAAATAPARYRDWSTGVRAVAPLGEKLEVQATGLAFDDHRTLRFAGADSRSFGDDASVRLLGRGAWQVDALAYLQARGFANRVISATSFRLTLDQRNTPSTGIGGKIELRPPVGAGHVLRLGGDLRHDEGELFEDAYGSTGALTTLRHAGGGETSAGLFVEDDWTMGRLVVTGGARLDRWTIVDGFFRETSPAGVPTTSISYPARSGMVPSGRAGVLVHIAPALDLRAAAYTGFRVPTLNELFRPYVVFPVTTQANAALAPERLRGMEAGADLRLGGATFGVTGYANRLGGAIANVTIGTNLRQRQNVRAIVSSGLELTAAWRHGPWSASASYALDLSHVSAPGSALDGLRPAQSPRHAASGTLAWQRPGGPGLSATLHHVGLQYEDDLQTAPLPAATTIDAVASVPVARGVRIVVRGENIGDARVVTRNSGGTVDLGTPRTWWLGVRLER